MEWILLETLRHTENKEVTEQLSGFTQGLGLGLTLAEIFVINMDSGIELTLGKSADSTKLCGAVNMLEGREAILKDVKGLERWDCANLSSGQSSRMLHLSQGNLKCKYEMDGEWIKSSPDRMD
ncbi:hypothetical protein TURU_066280 [Turdus rufiventris]|nr:hypothetical protein TURU_066280 [Turdus rufiventris]